MEIRTAEEAADEYKSYDAWQYADREAAWKWMFDRGVEAGNAHIYLQAAERIEADAQEIAALRDQLKGRWNAGIEYAIDVVREVLRESESPLTYEGCEAVQQRLRLALRSNV